MLSLLQTKRFYKRYYELKKDGDSSSIGMAGSNWKRKVYAVLVVNVDREIIHAYTLSGFTVFAGLKHVDGLEGRKLSDLTENPESFNLKKKVMTAFQHSAEFINRHDRKNELPDESELESESESKSDIVSKFVSA